MATFCMKSKWPHPEPLSYLLRNTDLRLLTVRHVSYQVPAGTGHEFAGYSGKVHLANFEQQRVLHEPCVLLGHHDLHMADVW
jgi:hypothetical protein